MNGQLSYSREGSDRFDREVRSRSRSEDVAASWQARALDPGLVSFSYLDCSSPSYLQSGRLRRCRYTVAALDTDSSRACGSYEPLDKEKCSRHATHGYRRLCKDIPMWAGSSHIEEKSTSNYPSIPINLSNSHIIYQFLKPLYRYCRRGSQSLQNFQPTHSFGRPCTLSLSVPLLVFGTPDSTFVHIS